MPFDLSVDSVVLYNPGLVYPWFFITGVMSVLLFLNGALVASALAVREKELGTIEQLLMSPAQTAELLLAKTTPVLIVLIADLVIALAAARVVFDLPVRGSLPVLLLAGVLAALAGTGIGIVLATYSGTQQQAQLLTFFMLPPIVLISGAFAPVEGMPPVLQFLSLLDPLRYLLVLIRGITLKGGGLATLWEPLVTLGAFAVILYGLSAYRFRKQLG
jgi:ABC-2 type transport system permease protein